ncbi:MAG: hypothetical protein FWG84_05945 [Bacteroidales bacterium]|nr:hypothetical protein [Bacteroidales bacterium]
MGYKLYIRDVSFLGFPAYHVYIPGMSEIKNIFSYDQFNRQFQKRRNYFLTAHNLKEATDEEIIQLLEALSWNDNTIITNFFNKQDAFSTTNLNLLKAILYNCVHLKDKALECLETFMKTTVEEMDNKSKMFFRCVRDMLYLEQNNLDINPLKNIYPISMLQETKMFLKERHSLDYVKISSCFDCSNCQIRSSCMYFDYAKLVKVTETVFANNIPNQEKVSSIFY